MNTTTQLIAAGFAKDPNSRTRWYAGGPGMMEPTFPLQLVVRGASDLALTVQPYGTVSESQAVDVFRFADVPDLLAFLARHGQEALPGLPAHSNSWD